MRAHRCAAGGFLAAVAKLFAVEVAGVDFASDLIRIAQRRVPGSFCAADAANLRFGVWSLGFRVWGLGFGV